MEGHSEKPNRQPRSGSVARYHPAWHVGRYVDTSTTIPGRYKNFLAKIFPPGNVPPMSEPLPTAETATRRPLPFQIPAPPHDETVSAAIIKSYDDLVAQRELHIHTLEQQMLATRNSLIDSLGVKHPEVGKLNTLLSTQSALWNP